MKTLYETIFDTTGVLDDVVRPKSNADLKDLIREYIDVIKPDKGDEVDLNWIDISGVDDLNHIFEMTNYIPVIDTWKIDHVKNFRCMFIYNKHIVRSPLPVLQEKLLAKRCYERMFANCTALEEPPELPAIELTENCYKSMFEGCTSLQVAPDLPAMELEDGCYSGMFVNCKALKEPPELPAIELTENCYKSMFEGCTSLEKQVKTPEKAPVHHADYAMYMYRDCPKIKD